MIDIFVDGLLNDHLKMKILRDQPYTLQGAVATCTNEQNLRTRVQMSHQASNSTHTSMKVDHSGDQSFKFKNRFLNLNFACSCCPYLYFGSAIMLVPYYVNFR